MESKTYAFPEDISEEAFLEEFRKINADESVDGILLFMPLPKHMNGKLFESAIDPVKDLDGISPVNRAKVFAGEADGFAPCTAEAVIEVLKAFEIPMAGKRAVVVGRSMVVGRPLSMLFLKENATVTVCHTKTADLKEECKRAEILVAAAGKAGMLDKEYVADGAVVIDVGINRNAEGKLRGDVNFDDVVDLASYITPVPGGVGPMTITMLMQNTLRAACLQNNITL